MARPLTPARRARSARATLFLVFSCASVCALSAAQGQPDAALTGATEREQAQGGGDGISPHNASYPDRIHAEMLVTPQQLWQAAVALGKAQEAAAKAQSSLMEMAYRQPDAVAAISEILDIAKTKLEKTLAELSPSMFPFYTEEGKWVHKGIRNWTTGFFPGSLWMLYELTGKQEFKTSAARLLHELEPIKNFRHTHDIGFNIMTSFGNAVRLAPELMTYGHATMLVAAEGLSSRFNDDVRALRSWDREFPAFGTSTFPVIIDNMMNLELLFVASKLPGGKPEWYHQALKHAEVTLHEHVREDGSTYHVVVFDPSSGAVLGKITHQGAGDDTTWSRGQAWAIYGFAIAYRETGVEKFLIAAHVAADWYLMHLTSDMIPPWDFSEGSARGLAGKDSSAAAIAAAGMLELCGMPGIGNHQYCEPGRRTLEVLSSPDYLDGFGGPQTTSALLKHGTGHMPKGVFDGGLVYGDYYYLKALIMLQRLELTQPNTFQKQWAKYAAGIDPSAVMRLGGVSDVEEVADDPY